jgi:hypothetical protein
VVLPTKLKQGYSAVIIIAIVDAISAAINQAIHQFSSAPSLPPSNTPSHPTTCLHNLLAQLQATSYHRSYL